MVIIVVVRGTGVGDGGRGVVGAVPGDTSGAGAVLTGTAVAVAVAGVVVVVVAEPAGCLSNGSQLLDVVERG